VALPHFNIEGRFVILTFGLLNPNKGIGLVLDVLPERVKNILSVKVTEEVIIQYARN